MRSDCGGRGKTVKTVRQDVRIPKGIDNGNSVKIKKMGHGNRDLIVEVSVKPHKHFRRDGYDIHTDKLITISQAVLGGITEIMSINGKRKITIPPGVGAGGFERLREQGVPHVYPDEHIKGDHIIHFKVKIPTYLNHEQKEAMKAFAAVEDPVIPDEPDI